MAKRNEEVQTTEEVATVEEVQTTEEVATVEEVQTTEEVATVEEVQTTEEVATSTSDASKKYVKTIPNPFDVRGHIIPDGEFGIDELDLDEEQEQAFNHAIKCGIIKEVE